MTTLMDFYQRRYFQGSPRRTSSIAPVILLLVVFSVAFFSAAFSSVANGNTATASPPRATILVMGDSISAAYGIQRDQGWVQLLTRQLKQLELPWQVVNASVSGETTAGGLARLPQAMATHEPQVVVIELGGNDGLRGYPTTTIHDNLRDMVDLALAEGCKVILVGMQIPPNYGPRYTRAFFHLYQEIATATDISLVPFFLEKVALVPELMQDDGIHPTSEAQPLLLQTFWEQLEPLLVAGNGIGTPDH